MKNDWCVFSKIINKRTCEEIIAAGKSLPMGDGTVKSNDAFVVNDFRKSKVSFFNKDMPEYVDLFAFFWTIAHKANIDWFNFHLSKMDFIQFAEYDSTYKGKYDMHEDTIWINDTDFHRKLSMVVQLSDPNSYEGGDFIIHEPHTEYPKDIFRNQGSVIVFPSFKKHAALPVTKGTRYSLAIWVEGPKFH